MGKTSNQTQYRLVDAFEETCNLVARNDQLEQENAELRAEIARIRERRHTHQTIEMIEEAQAALMDIRLEMDIYQQVVVGFLRIGNLPALIIYNAQFARYIRARIDSGMRTLQRGRKGPYSYTASTTAGRPDRPGMETRG